MQRINVNTTLRVTVMTEINIYQLNIRVLLYWSPIKVVK